MTKKSYKTIRAVVEVRVPQNITEKKLVLHLKNILEWPLQLGFKGDRKTLFKTSIKSYAKFQQAEDRNRRQAEIKRLKRKWSGLGVLGGTDD